MTDRVDDVTGVEQLGDEFVDVITGKTTVEDFLGKNMPMAISAHEITERLAALDAKLDAFDEKMNRMAALIIDSQRHGGLGLHAPGGVFWSDYIKHGPRKDGDGAA